MADPLQNRWLELWQSLEAHGDPLPVYQSLVARYSEPHRAYHNLVHIQHCLDEFEPVQRLAKYGGAIPMAIWFHDAIYDPKGKDNEEQSGNLAAQALKSACLPEGFGQHVKRLILATKHNMPPEAGGSAVIVDVDLSILGQSRERFSQYEAEIRQEYAWAPDDAFAKGRSAILKSFLERPSIYNTPFFKEKYETAARRNLEWSLERLRSAG